MARDGPFHPQIDARRLIIVLPCWMSDMLRYLPATFLYTSQVAEDERSELDKVYMPFVLANAHKLSQDTNTVRTDYFDRSVEPWGPFVDIMFRHFRKFVSEHLASSGAFVVRFKPWFNYYVSGSAMTHHSHPGNDFGLIYCLRNAGKKSTLFNTFSHEYMCMEDRYPKIDRCTFNWNPEPGEFVFFPASLFHGAQATEIDGERVTLIANIVMVNDGKSDELSLRVEQTTTQSQSPS
jgi:hypothetical protein